QVAKVLEANLRKKEGLHKLDRLEKWRKVYKMIFDVEDNHIPDPRMGVGDKSTPESLGDYLRRVMPGQIRRLATAEVDRIFGPQAEACQALMVNLITSPNYTTNILGLLFHDDPIQDSPGGTTTFFSDPTMTTFSTDPALYIFTSLTAGSSHIVTATSRLETILRANRVPFKAVDLATDQKARMLWGRRAGKDASGRVRKLPGLAQEGLILGDLVEIEDWNEYGELKQHVKIYYDEFTIPNIHNKPKDPPKRFVHPITGAPMKGGPKAGSKAAAGAAAAAAAAAAASASSSSSAKPAAPPAAPPLPPADEKKAATAAPAKKAETGEKVTMPIRSIADEAAQKAKDLRLAALREKVHGSKAKAEEKAKAEASTEKKAEDKAAAEKTEDKAAAEKTEDKAVEEKKKEGKPTEQTENKSAEKDTTAEKEAEAKPAPTTPAKTTASTSTSSLATTSSSAAASSSISAFRAATALQSPTRTTWVPASPASTDALRETLQSPTTARWKAAATEDHDDNEEEQVKKPVAAAPAPAAPAADK
ncbi:hypothetical protein BN1708_000514, partial [Verticillium longisporum]